MNERQRETDDLYAFVDCDEDTDFATRIIHQGESPSASAFPIYQANTVEGVYVRMRNPTVEALEEKLRGLEGGAATVAMASGMAAVSHTLLGLLQAGDRVVAHRSLFVGVRTLLDDFVAKLGIEVERVNLNAPDELARRWTVNAAGVLRNDQQPGAGSGQRAGGDRGGSRTRRTGGGRQHAADAISVSAARAAPTWCCIAPPSICRGTATCWPAWRRSATRSCARSVHKARRILGGHLSPLAAFLVMRGMKTLPLRMTQHCDNAQRVAEFLACHPHVKTVHYPGLPSTPGHALASSFLPAFGGIVSFEPQAGFDWATFAGKLKLCRPGMSFGDAATRVQREGPIRLAVGLERTDDILRDLEQAMAG